MTEEVLNSVKAARNVISFVSTSSRIGSFHTDGTPQRISSKDWFDQAPSLVEKVPEEMKGVMVYAASKVAGEEAVWKWVQSEKVSRPFSLRLPMKLRNEFKGKRLNSSFSISSRAAFSSRSSEVSAFARFICLQTINC